MDRDRPPDVLTDLAAWVHRRCGFLIWAHPFRYGRKVSPAWLDELPIDGIEIASSNMDLQMGEAALSVAELYGLKTFVNSDAHRQASLGCYGSDFEADITTMDQLIDYLNGDDLAGSKIGTGL